MSEEAPVAPIDLEPAPPALRGAWGPLMPGPPDGRPDPWWEELARSWDVAVVIERVVAEDLRSVFTDLQDDEEFVSGLRGSVSSNVETFRRFLCGDIHAGDVQATVPAAFAARQAELGIAQETMQRSYRVGLAQTWRSWTEHVEAVGEREGVDARRRLDAVVWGTDALQTLADHTMTQVAGEYANRESALRRTGAQVRRHMLEAVIAGQSDASYDDLFSLLRYDFSASHQCVLLTDATDSEVHTLTGRFRQVAGVSGAIELRLSINAVALWVGKPRDWEADTVGELRSLLQEFGAQASLGEPGRGLDGFRASLGDARFVADVARRVDATSTVVELDDVLLDAVLMAQPTLGNRFVRRELGPLAEPGRTMGVLRETLLASYEEGSHVAAAEALAVHEHTIRKRLHRIEELLGRRVTERRLHLYVALRMYPHVTREGAAEEG